MTATDRITDDEAAILRSWLGGNSPGAIGKARREPEGRIVTVLSRLCGLDRAAGRRVLDSGRRPAPTPAPGAAEPPTEPAPELDPTLPPPTVVGGVDVDRAALVTERDQLRADLDDAKAERDLWRCPGCGYIGPPSGHRPLPARVCLTPDPDELQPVTVAILPREATG